MSWEYLPPEIWLPLFAKLPLKSQVSLACTCKRLYRYSLDHLLGNLEQRAWIYLGAHKPLPPLLTQAVRIVRIPPPQDKEKEKEGYSKFLLNEIGRITHLKQVILGRKTRTEHYYLSCSDVHELVQQHNLGDVKVPEEYLFHRSASRKTLLHLAVEKGSIALLRSLLSQIEVCFYKLGAIAPYILPAIPGIIFSLKKSTKKKFFADSCIYKRIWVN